jgi:preprotein translocase subunit YajC
MFISDAFAQEASNAAQNGAQGGGIIGTVIYFLVIILIFYFLLIRPQQKKIKQQQQIINSLEKGDEVITIGGLIGKIVNIKKHNEVVIEITDGVRISILKNAVSTKLSDDKLGKEDKKGE